MEASEFIKAVNDLPQRKFEPAAFYDRDGDRLEFLIAPDPYKAERLDDWVTVYRSRQTQEIVGSVIKNMNALKKQFPGLCVEIQSGATKLSHFFRAPSYSAGDPAVHRVYVELIERADQLGLTAECQTTA